MTFESRTPSSRSARSWRANGRMAAAATTGPAQAPRPTSSRPATYLAPPRRSLSSYWRSGLGVCRIYPLPPVAPDDEQVVQHRQRIADQAHSASGGVVPRGRHLNHPGTSLQGDEEELDIALKPGYRGVGVGAG